MGSKICLWLAAGSPAVLREVSSHAAVMVLSAYQTLAFFLQVAFHHLSCQKSLHYWNFPWQGQVWFFLDMPEWLQVWAEVSWEQPYHRKKYTLKNRITENLGHRVAENILEHSLVENPKLQVAKHKGFMQK